MLMALRNFNHKSFVVLNFTVSIPILFVLFLKLSVGLVPNYFLMYCIFNCC